VTATRADRALIKQHCLAAVVSGLSVGSVYVGSVFDRDDRDLFVDAVDDPEVAAAGAVQAFQSEPQRLAQPVWIVRERPVAELDDRGGHLLRQPL
jgi:hypothetical protein